MPTMTERSFLGLSATGFHRVAYTEWGTGPRTIVCVHGLTRNSRDFDVLAADLAETLKARVVCPDVVGRGRSDRLVNPDNYGYPQYMSDMAALIARLDVETVEWVGTSMGGLIGMLLAAQPNSPISRMVINDVGPFVPKAALQRIADYVGVEHAFEDLNKLESYLRATYAGFGKLTDAQWAHLAQHSARGLPDGRLGLAYDTGIARIFAQAPIGDVDLWPVWSMIRCPVLAIRGVDSDLLQPETARRMAEEGPKAKVVEIAETGHAPALMDPAQIAAIRDFLGA
ncbi:alpha/beta fold hydrolase [Indioceanicola profundi]|uniref:alpha/beta fold hydrolase n=1 Tax=Indioceanicola profundi TaxID=2220096 RepID=UPI000E6AA915|nr:alpha/beta hydrolase [Indioceanicola profundi]